MNRRIRNTVGLALLSLLWLAMPAIAAETWKDVSLVDANCSQKVKANPDAHTTKCALGCAKGGYGIFAADGTWLKFDEAGNKLAVEALTATKKTDHLRATVSGERQGDTIKVASLTLDGAGS